jgi:hypothetical protein
MPLQTKGNDAIVKRARTPAQQRQELLGIDNGNNTIIMMGTIAIATMAKEPAHWRQRRHHNKGTNTSLTTSSKGNNASSIMAETPAHQQRQQCHSDKSKNCHRNKLEMPAC